MTSIIGRETELGEMERRYANPNIKTLAIWGRRRVGKTALIREFCKDKPHVILTAIEDSYQDSMKSFDMALNDILGPIGGKSSEHFTDILKRLNLR